jgi:G3E family GTPase
MSKGLVPVTILTGFLGSGKTTLLNRILKERARSPHCGDRERIRRGGHRQRVAGAGPRRADRRNEQRLHLLHGAWRSGAHPGRAAAKRRPATWRSTGSFIETTGLADPAPVAQTFFIDEDIGMHYLLDAIVTLVDAVHAPQQLLTHHEAQEQVGFADRILLTKTDLVPMADILTLKSRLQRMNPRAPILESRFGDVPLDQVLDLRGFNLNAILEIEPDFLTDVEHEHDDDVTSFVFREDRPLSLERVEEFLGAMVQVYGTQLMRYKGILHVEGQNHRIVFQGVHMLMGADLGAPWREGEARESRMVFIGKDMPRDVLLEGLRQTVAQAQGLPA